jgi:hypothetical protein
VEGALAGEAHRAKLGGEAGAVEVGDAAGELEQVTLVGDAGSVAYPRARCAAMARTASRPTTAKPVRTRGVIQRPA